MALEGFSQAPPVAGFTANVTSGCAPLTVRFTDQSTNNPTSWNWELSNGTLSSAQNPVVTFSTPGVYSVRLVVQNANGVSQTERVDYITVYPAPVANFSANIRLGCVPSVIQFTDMSTIANGSIASWSWSFGDGATSNQQNPSHTYNSEGYYTVILRITSNNGCTSTITRSSYIRVVGSVSTNFSFSQPNRCQAPFGVTFSNQSSGPGALTYEWDFGNGQTSTAANPTVIYNAAGTYTVRLNSRSSLGCTGTVQRQVTVTATTTDFIAPASVCLGQPITFQNNSSQTPLTSSWSFGDGTQSAQINPTRTYLVPGTYNVKLVNRYANCTDSVTKQVIVVDRPQVDFRANDSTFCQAPATVQFTDLTPGAAGWLWDFGDGTTSTQQNPSHTYTALGDYTVRLTVTSPGGCSATVTRPAFIRIQEPEITLNAPTGGCIPFTYTPSAIINTLDSIATYTWDLGDGTIVTGRNPGPHVYNNAGVYPISLTITTVSGCSRTITITEGIRTGTPPTPGFSFTPVNACASQTISFTNTSITTPGAEVVWSWDFGDGNTSSVQNPQHIFRDTGLLNVRLSVSNDRCTRFITQTVQVRPPVARFISSFDCNTRQATFTNTGLYTNTLAPLSFAWNFGNGQTSTDENPAPVTYTPGTYPVRLTITNGSCTDTYARTIIVADEPADFQIAAGPYCRNSPVSFTAVNSNPNVIANYLWTANGSPIGNGRTLSHSFTANGDYDIRLRITDLNGCVTTSAPQRITVGGPLANFEPVMPGACLSKEATFRDISTSVLPITNWSFNFGDGTTQTFTAPPFTHTYNRLGTFDVSMTITDAAGCRDTDTLPVSLLVTDPKAGFRADTFYCPQAPLQFSDTSIGAGLTYMWEFGDGGTSTAANPLHSYPAGNADYTVKLKITDIAGCSDSVTRAAYIKVRSPQAAFAIRDTITLCPPLRTGFTFQGSDYSRFLWSFGDGGQSTLRDPNYFYGSYGTFTPKLYVYGNGGCVDSAASSVTVHDPNAIRINYGPLTRACNSLNVDFDLVIPDGYPFTLYFGDGTADSSQQKTLSHFYSRPGFSRPYLVVRDTISGCEITINGATRIDVMGAIPLFSMDRSAFCDNGNVTFSNFTTRNEPIISQVWTFGDGGTSTDQNPVHNYTQPGLYPVRLTVTTQSNCTSFYTDTVEVYRTPAPVITGRDTICLNVLEPYAGSLTVADTLTNWQWNFGNGQTSNEVNGSATYQTSGNFTITLTATNLIGCRSSATKTIHVAPPPTAAPVQDPLIIPSGGGANLAMNYTGRVVGYAWTPQYRLNCFDCPSPLANPQTTNKYRVDITDVWGCRNHGEITVVVVCNDKNFTIPNTFSPNGDGVNDVFFPKGSGLVRVKSLLIFNRWGELVFEKKDFPVNDPAAGWNGLYKGQKASADAYVYHMELICENNEVVPVKGNITLLR